MLDLPCLVKLLLFLFALNFLPRPASNISRAPLTEKRVMLPRRLSSW